ncbi:hypothetical protein NGM37_14205, partial [Streptomyces sp. TRM76130]|nr:hypothetical protein [Streptomyces sp. TRM76130]
AGLTGHLAGTEEQVAEGLEALLEETDAQEVLVTTSTYDRAALHDSYRRLARVVGAGQPDRGGDSRAPGAEADAG